MAQRIESQTVVWETQVRSLNQEDPLEEGMVTHPGILARKIPITVEPDGLRQWVAKRQTQLSN